MTITLKNYGDFLKTIPDAAVVINSHGILKVVNPQTAALFGYSIEQVFGKALGILLPKAVAPFHAKMIEGYFASPKMRAMGSGMAIKGLHADGHEFPMDIMLKPITFSSGQYALCIMRDITVVKKQEELLQKALANEQAMALTDYLTSIANSRAFHIALETEMNRFERFGRPYTLVYFDLDHFKAVNDERGHAEGDKVLVQVVKTVTERLRKTDIFARLGGDEFVILLTETDAEIAKNLIAKLQESLLQAMQERGWPITFSIGVLTCKNSVESPNALIKLADALMYDVKKHGKNAVKYSVLG